MRILHERVIIAGIYMYVYVCVCVVYYSSERENLYVYGLDIFNLSDGKSVRTFYLEFYSNGLCRRALRAAFQAISPGVENI